MGANGGMQAGAVGAAAVVAREAVSAANCVCGGVEGDWHSLCGWRPEHYPQQFLASREREREKERKST